MNAAPKKEDQKPWEKWKDQVEKMETRKLRSRRERFRSLWFGMGMFGLIGWSVAVPVLLGVAVGIWIDTHWPGRISWTLTLIFVGTAVGCLHAWYWIKQESGRNRWKK